MSLPTDTSSLVPQPSAPPPTPTRARRWRIVVGLVFVGLFAMSVVASLTGANELTGSGTFGAALRLAVPILLAALGGLYAERSGVINIGLEGMMIMGTWFAAYGSFYYGPWWGLVLGVLGGAMGGLLHAVATVTFNVDHIISGVAINILALGGMRFLSVVAWADPSLGGGATQSPRVSGLPTFDVPLLGQFFTWVERQSLFFISDIASVLRAATVNVSWLTVIALSLVPLTWFLLWRTSWGLRLRSCGENPWAAESLGVSVYLMKYWGVVISGALAGMGGAFLVLVQAGVYREDQTAGRGFIGLATMIFGNWRPSGALGGAFLFGFADSLRLRDPAAVRALFLLAALVLGGIAAWAAWRRARLTLIGTGLAGLIALAVFLTVRQVPGEFIFVTPYVVTLLVLAFASQRLRPPAADGAQYRKGETD